MLWKQQLKTLQLNNNLDISSNNNAKRICFEVISFSQKYITHNNN
jgi:hypothetical protein